MSKHCEHMIRNLVLSIFIMSISGCDQYLSWSQPPELQLPNAELVVLTMRKPLQFDVDPSKQMGGIDHDLVQDMAKLYNLKVKFKVLNSEQKLLSALKNGEGDLIAAGLRAPTQLDGLALGPAYDETDLSLFCRRSSKVSKVSDLENYKLLVPFRDRKNPQLSRLQKMVPSLTIDTATDNKIRTVFHRVNNGEANCLIAETWEGAILLREFTALENVQSITPSYTQHWILREQDEDLKKALSFWHQKALHSGLLVQTEGRYKDHLAQVDRRDINLLYRKIRDELPKHLKDFKANATKFGLPWQLVAAVGFQESHWNNEATSFTGVKGLMQITNLTAQHLGIEDRQDSQQSIEGGAKYIRSLLESMPKELNPRDRLALALAAYNVGPNHLRDAQKLAQLDGQNYWSWAVMQKYLPYLAEDSYLEHLEYGPARGSETVIFVRRTLNFYEVLRNRLH